MNQLIQENTTDICTTLFYRLTHQGFSPLEVNRIVKDTYNILKNGGNFTITLINSELTRLGWPHYLLDDFSFELIIALLEKEFDFTIRVHSIH